MANSRHPVAPQTWLNQQIAAMSAGINAGKTRKRNVQSALGQGVTEAMIRAAAEAQGWRVAQIGDDYVFAPGNYTIRPIV